MDTKGRSGRKMNANENSHEITEPAATKRPRQLQLSSGKDKSLKYNEARTGFDRKVAASSTLETDQLRKKAAEVATPRTL